MDAASVIREARRRSGMSLRELAARADTSHSAISAYETGRRIPTTATLDRIARAAGFALDATLRPRVYADNDDRGAELEEVLALAAEFPTRHSPNPPGPVFGRPQDPHAMTTRPEMSPASPQQARQEHSSLPTP